MESCIDFWGTGVILWQLANAPERILTVVFDLKKNRAWAQNLSIVMQLGLTMAGCILFCLWVGLTIDKWLGTKGIFVTIFILLGIVGGGVTVYRQIIEAMEAEKNDSDHPDNGI